MPSQKISALSHGSIVDGTEKVPIVQGGSTKYVTIQELTEKVRNYSSADQTINAATTALLTGSTLAVPANGLQVGTIFQWTLIVSKTAAGTAGNIFVFQLGTAGSTADADILTFTLPTATGVIDQARIDIAVTIRGPLGASCIAQGSLTMTHNLSATGFATVPCVVLKATSSAFTSSTANLIASLVCTTAASTVLTFQQVISDATNL